MNKISKKIVALVTMAAFVLTLVPAAAFAAAVDADYSTYKVESNNAGELTVTVNYKGNDGNTADTGAKKAKVMVSVDGVADSTEVATTGVDVSSNQTTAGAVKAGVNASQGSFELTFTYKGLSAGDYTVKVGLDTEGNTNYTDLKVADGTTNKVYVDGVANGEASKYGVLNNGKVDATATVNVDTDLETGFYINDANEDATADTLDQVTIWAENKAGNVSGLSSVVVVDENGDVIQGKVTDNKDGSFTLNDVANGTRVNVQFSATGEYTLYAGVGADVTNAEKAYIGGTNASFTTVTVTDDTVVDSMTLTASWLDNGTDPKQFDTGVFTYDEDAETYTLDLTGVEDFNFNGIDKIVLNGTALENDGSKAKYQTINFTVNEPNTVVELDKASDNTSNTGTFETAFTMQSQKNAVITVTDEATGVSYDVLVIAQKTSATNIDRTKTAGYVLATTDDQWSADVNANLGDAVEFKVTDEKGNAVEGLKATDFVIDVRDKASKSTLTASDLEVVEVGDGFYTLQVKASEVASDKNILTEGKYEVRVALAGVDSENDNATVTFNAAEFGKIKNVELNIKAGDVALDDQITLGTTATVSLVYVDANGVKVAGPTDFDWNATNSALAIDEKATTGTTLAMKPDTIEHQGVVGSVVKVQASVPGYGLVEKDLTIVSSYNEYSMKFDPTEGPVNEYNKVDLSVLNSDGDVAKNIDGTVNVVVVDSSNEDAKVSAKVAKNVDNGEGALTVYASQETELELVVTVVKDGKILAADTLNYTVGAADPLAGRSVVMTIGSSEYVVNNQIVTGDAAPFIDSNWRTMVPIRALAEAFDAEVNWDNDARTVTINYDADTQIVMTIGEDTYTVNGAEQTMDTEPVIQGDRTYVPIRFAAEALGFTVTPLYNSNGLTGSVVFQR
ncbi:MAG: copper amine oxidase N-terminal domain-containing protein [Peptococcaceae bacterium]|nr:copper amine oxidase N-terminal domain-containing protein [Peptococcaceae bacterium]